MSRNILLLGAATAVCLTASLANAQSAPDPRAFAEKAASSNLFEIQSSQIALEQPISADVKAFAEQMIKDHTLAGEKMQAAAQKDSITPPAEMSNNDQAQLKKLQAANGEFEDAYLAAQSTAHDEAVALFTTFSQNGQDSALRVFATETLPTLQMHQTEVHKLTQEH